MYFLVRGVSGRGLTVGNLLGEVTGDTLPTEEYFHGTCKCVQSLLFERFIGGIVLGAAGGDGGKAGCASADFSERAPCFAGCGFAERVVCAAFRASAPGVE